MAGGRANNGDRSPPPPCRCFARARRAVRLPLQQLLNTDPIGTVRGQALSKQRDEFILVGAGVIVCILLILRLFHDPAVVLIRRRIPPRHPSQQPCCE